MDKILGIERLRILEKEDPILFEDIKQNYHSRKCRDFCNEYHIGVTSALRLFGRKRIEKEIYSEEDEFVLEYKKMLKQNDRDKKDLQKYRYIHGDIDDYYSKRQY